MSCLRRLVALSALLCLLCVAAGQAVSDDAAATAFQPVPDVQVLPLPYDQASFRHNDRELTCYHFGAGLNRPFWYPIMGEAGRSLTRMGHPHDPVSHSHHNSVWITHKDVGGVSFWEDRNPKGGRIVQQTAEQFDDGKAAAAMISTSAWLSPEGKPRLLDRRRAEVAYVSDGDWTLSIDLELRAPGKEPVVLGATPFGILGVRLTKPIGVNDGGGRLMNSEGKQGEPEIFRKPARWVDYSGAITNQHTAGITLMDHPDNPHHPTPFHVRSDGWMCASITCNEALTIEPEKPVRLRYRLWVHSGVPTLEAIGRQWQTFSQAPAAELYPKKK